MKLLCNILPDLQNQVGHVHQYALSTQKAVESIGWSYTAWIPTNCEVAFLPPNWIKALPPIKTKNFLNRLTEPFRYFLAFRKALNQLNQNRETIFFLEHFRIPHLVSLFLALLFTSRPFQVWLLHRYPREKMCCRGNLHRLLYKMFQWLYRIPHIHFLSDSDLLSREQSNLFQAKVATLPIPHGQTSSALKFPKEPKSIYCWWPGGATRESKGLKEICLLSQFLQKKPSAVKLIVAKNALAKGVAQSESLILVEDLMDRTIYEKWLNTVDIALLPYSPVDYRLSTSGIFVETISNGLIPITSKNTWMAHELQKYDLLELAIDWAQPQLITVIESLATNPIVRRKIESMQKAYKSFHTIERFANTLETHSKNVDLFYTKSS